MTEFHYSVVNVENLLEIQRIFRNNEVIKWEIHDNAHNSPMIYIEYEPKTDEEPIRAGGGFRIN